MFPALFPGAEINRDPNGCVNGVPREKVNKLQRRYLIKPPVSVSLGKRFLKRVRPRDSTQFLWTESQTIIAKEGWGEREGVQMSRLKNFATNSCGGKGQTQVM